VIAMGGGDGRLKRQASSMKIADIPQVIKDLKQASFEEKESVAHLMDVIAVQHEQNPSALVGGGAIKPLIELVASGNDGSQVYAASTLATIAAAKQEYQDKIIKAGGIEPLCALLHSARRRTSCLRRTKRAGGVDVWRASSGRCPALQTMATAPRRPPAPPCPLEKTPATRCS
jgi:hypothetical protein